VAQNLFVVTAADAASFPLLEGLVASLRAHAPDRGTRLGVLDLGLAPAQREWAARAADRVAEPEWHFDFPGRDRAPGSLRGVLARPFLPRYFPGAELYLWLDPDALVLDGAALELFARGAAERGLAAVPAFDRGAPDRHAAAGPAGLGGRPVLGAGAVAAHRDAPHWAAWADALAEEFRAGPSEAAGREALDRAVRRGGLLGRTELLPAWCNWGPELGPPTWDAAAGRLVEPCLPRAPIGVFRRGGPDPVAELPCASGGTAAVRLGFPPAPAAPPQPSGPLQPGDYVSPGLKVVVPDAHFPHLTRGDPARSDWPHLRRWVPHRWYVDARAPAVGFVSRDEAAILYNTALRFRGRRALEVGCWMGWSACHLALGGVSLDVLDPSLARPVVRDSVESSLASAGVRGLVNLVAEPSPEGVAPLAGGRRWSLFFVDGNHEAPGPVRDAEACAAHADEDALVLFHDLAAPAVGAALDRLRELGWRTLVYQTMQVMGAAWRGRAAPVAHAPDPAVDWRLPDHLRGHPVSS
jgi:hypothetical protein